MTITIVNYKNGLVFENNVHSSVNNISELKEDNRLKPSRTNKINLMTNKFIKINQKKQKQFHIIYVTNSLDF